jgi:hypothetical protein
MEEPRRGATPWRSHTVEELCRGAASWRCHTMEEPRPRRGGVALTPWRSCARAVELPCRGGAAP